MRTKLNLKLREYLNMYIVRIGDSYQIPEKPKGKEHISYLGNPHVDV